MPSVKAFAPATKAKTILATSSAVLPLASTSPLSGYLLPSLIASAALPVLFGLILLPILGSSEGEGEGEARSPVLRMIEPSIFERIRVDWTPGLDARRERFSRVAAGCGFLISSEEQCSYFQEHTVGCTILAFGTDQSQAAACTRLPQTA